MTYSDDSAMIIDMCLMSILQSMRTYHKEKFTVDEMGKLLEIVGRTDFGRYGSDYEHIENVLMSLKDSMIKHNKQVISQSEIETLLKINKEH